MKNLKIKFGLFSLLAMLSVSVFLTSCEQSSTIIGEQLEEVEQVSQESEFKGVLVPEAIATQEEATVRAYLEGLSDEALEEHVNDYIIMDFFKNEGLEDVAVDEFAKNESLKNLNLSDYLSDEKVEALNNNIWTPTQISDRCCHTRTQFMCWVSGSTLYCANVTWTQC